MHIKCTICGKNHPIYLRRYSGEKLCSKCFCDSVENKVRTTISRYNMLRFDDKVAVGLSGGKDSITLLYILKKLERAFPNAELVALTIDEGIEGYRDEALKITAKVCKSLDVKHIIVSFKKLFNIEMDEIIKWLEEKKIKELTACAYCGVLRRRALNITAREFGATKLATAHNLDDETQTVMLNIIHGDPLRISQVRPISIRGDPHFVCRIKPFSELLERETTMYAYLRKLDFQNYSCPYSHNALRNDIRGLLNRMEEKHPGLKYTIFSSSKKLRGVIDKTLEPKIERFCKLCNEPSSNEICQPCKMLQGFSQ